MCISQGSESLVALSEASTDMIKLTVFDMKQLKQSAIGDLVPNTDSARWEVTCIYPDGARDGRKLKGTLKVLETNYNAFPYFRSCPISDLLLPCRRGNRVRVRWRLRVSAPCTQWLRRQVLPDSCIDLTLNCFDLGVGFIHTCPRSVSLR